MSAGMTTDAILDHHGWRRVIRIPVPPPRRLQVPFAYRLGVASRLTILRDHHEERPTLTTLILQHESLDPAEGARHIYRCVACVYCEPDLLLSRLVEHAVVGTAAAARHAVSEAFAKNVPARWTELRSSWARWMRWHEARRRRPRVKTPASRGKTRRPARG